MSLVKPVSEAERLAAMGDLRELIRLAEARGELERVKGADTHLEMGALYELSLRDEFPPLLLFEDIKNHPKSHRVLMNVRFSRIFQDNLDLESLKAFRKRRKWEAEPIAPEEVNVGPICDNIVRDEAVNVRAFPAGHWHAEDGGPYIGTECLIINKDPDSDWVNVGTYRVQVQDEKTFTVFIEPGKHGSIIREKYWAKGEACPMVVCVGQAPILGVVASTASRQGVSEFATAGGRLGKPIRVIRGEVTGLPIPADAELAFEGFMPPPSQETRPEGPFAEWPGYYATEQHAEPVVRVKRIYHRNDPILIGQPPAKPTFPGRQPSLAGMAAIWDALEAAGVPGITGVWKPLGGGVSFVNVIAIKQLHAGHAKMAGLVAAGCGPAAYMTRIIIIVDDDIDITNPAEVMWALATRWDPKTQTDIIDGCWTGYIDPLLPPTKRDAHDMTNSRIIIYAVRPFHWRESFPKVNAVDPSYAEEVRRKWAGRLRFLQR